MTIFIISYLLCGSLVGFLAGLFGIGGGIIGIPILFSLFSLQGMPETTAMHMAIGTFLTTVIITSASSTYAHHRIKNILYPIVKMMLAGVMIGCAIGVLIASFLSGIWLKRFFGVFLLFVAARSFLSVKMKKEITLPDKPQLFFSATLIGIISGLLGLGGGVFMVPFLQHYGVPIRNAIATATACILPVAIIGSVGYMISGVNVINTPVYSTGFIYWPAFICISLTSVFFAPLGVKAARFISAELLKKLFELCVLLAGLDMLLHK